MKVYTVEGDEGIISIHKTKKGAEDKIKCLSGDKYHKYSQSWSPQIHKRRPYDWVGEWVEPKPITPDDFATEYTIKEVDLKEDENQPK